MITRIRGFAGFWYDFIVGDDWQVAAGVVGALAVTFLVGRTIDLPVWWIGVASIALLLPVSIYRVARRQPRVQRDSPS